MSEDLAELYQAGLASLAGEVRAVRQDIAQLREALQDMRSAASRAAPMSALDRAEARLAERIGATADRVDRVEARIGALEQQASEAAAADRAAAAASAAYVAALRLFTWLLGALIVLVSLGVGGALLWVMGGA